MTFIILHIIVCDSAQDHLILHMWYFMTAGKLIIWKYLFLIVGFSQRLNLTQKYVQSILYILPGGLNVYIFIVDCIFFL